MAPYYTHTSTYRHVRTEQTPGLHLLFTVHRVNTVPSETASQQQDVVVRHVLAQQHPLPMSLINSLAVLLSSCPSNRSTCTSATASTSANVTHIIVHNTIHRYQKIYGDKLNNATTNHLCLLCLCNSAAALLIPSPTEKLREMSPRMPSNHIRIRGGHQYVTFVLERVM